MKKWNASVTLTLSIDYENIEAETEEEAKRIAEEKAYEDVDFNNCNCDDSAVAYVWENKESKADMEKPTAIYRGFSQHDCESHYTCPVCGINFGGWSVFANKPNENGNKHYCPNCKTELGGLE